MPSNLSVIILAISCRDTFQKFDSLSREFLSERLLPYMFAHALR
eukprot:UN18165